MTFFSPLSQFETVGFDWSFFYLTNMGLLLCLYTAVSLIVFFIIFLNNKYVIKSPITFVLFSFLSLVKDVVCSETVLGNFFLSWFVMLVTVLFFFNVFSLIPFGFTVSAHIVVSLSLSFIFFFWINLVYFLRFSWEWVAIFLPSGSPTAIIFLLVPIEIISYFSRILSLAIRLFANMMSGHTLLHILGAFLYGGLSLNFLILIPVILVHLIIGMEVGVAILQIYVFTVLCSLYLSDVTHWNSH